MVGWLVGWLIGLGIQLDGLLKNKIIYTPKFNMEPEN